MKTSFNVLFYLKKPRNYKSGPMPVYMRITVDGQRAETSISRECEPASGGMSKVMVFGLMCIRPKNLFELFCQHPFVQNSLKAFVQQYW
ncbi:MAG: Arm DNA-binding domain-containing protein [Bacteroidota bacterium]